MLAKIISLTAIALGMSSAAVSPHASRPIEATEVTIRATWTCAAPRPLASDETATVRECRWIVQ